MTFIPTAPKSFNGSYAKSGKPIKVKKFKNGDHYEYGTLPGGKFYCRWKTVYYDSGLRIYKTLAGAKSKMESELQCHEWSREVRSQNAYARR